MPISNNNPADIAAQEALNRLYSALQENRNFIFEAGAGAGKTYSLIKALQYLIQCKGKKFAKEHKKIACITFTNVAKEQIDIRTDKHPIVHTDTIHAFCWSLIRNFQVELRKALPSISKWPERLAKYQQELASANESNSTSDEAAIGEGAAINYSELLGKKNVIYQLGYPSIDEQVITLGHDDILHLMIHLLSKEKFRNVLFSKYPIILVDEYQDTYAGIATALQEHFINANSGPQIGFFGDHWQKIYGHGCGQIDNHRLLFIPKNANFRSVATIVNILNAMRPKLRQEPEDPTSVGYAQVFHTNQWLGTRRTGNHWAGDLPAEHAHNYLGYVRFTLEESGWDFNPERTKILMLTHNVLASEQGYKELADVFSSNEAYIKKEDKFMAFFMDVIEPISEAFMQRKYGEMFQIVGLGKYGINSHGDKVLWNERMGQLLDLRMNGNIGDVLDFLISNNKPRVPENIVEACSRFSGYVAVEGVEEPSEISKLRKLRQVPYSQVIAVKEFITDHTPFATKHSVKGEEFENVLVVVGRGWNLYNFDQMLTWFGNVPAGKEESFERARNLFYVACSRSKVNLAILFTQQLSQASLNTLESWFGTQNVVALDAVLPSLN